jgi:tetratricopeptide (TPR) repeat protein
MTFAIFLLIISFSNKIFAETDEVKRTDIAVFLGNTDNNEELSESVMLLPCDNFNSSLYSSAYAVYNKETSELAIVGEKKNSKNGRFALLDKQDIGFVGVIDEFSCKSNKIILHGKWAFRATFLTYNYTWNGKKLIKCKVEGEDYTQNQIDELRDMALEGKITSKIKDAFEEGSVLYPQNYFRKKQILDRSNEGLQMGVMKASKFYKNHSNAVAANILKGVFYYIMALYEESFSVDDSHPYTLTPDDSLYDDPTYWVRVLKEIEVESKYYISALNDYGFYLTNINKYQDAIVVLKVVLEEKPDRIPVYLNLADAYYGNNNRKEALMLYKTYIKLMKEHKKENRIPSYVINRAK